MPIHDDEQKSRYLAKKTCHRARLVAQRRVEEGRKIQTHLKAHHLTGEFCGGKNKPHSKTNGQADTHLLQHRAGGLGSVDADQCLARQARLCRHGNQQRQGNPGAHRKSP